MTKKKGSSSTNTLCKDYVMKKYPMLSISYTNRSVYTYKTDYSLKKLHIIQKKLKINRHAGVSTAAGLSQTRAMAIISSLRTSEYKKMGNSSVSAEPPCR